MTNTELIAKIKAEIERLKGIGGIVPLDNREQKTGYESALIDVETFLDSLESEKPTEQDVELNGEIKKEMANLPLFIRGKDQIAFARHFAEWGYLRAAEKYNEIEYNRQRAEESVPNDLEEAAKDYTDSSEWSIGENLEHIDAAFIAGAERQAKQMMKEAVEGKIIFLLNGDVAVNIGDTDKYNLGQKVRVIVLPKEDEK